MLFLLQQETQRYLLRNIFIVQNTLCFKNLHVFLEPMRSATPFVLQTIVVILNTNFLQNKCEKYNSLELKVQFDVAPAAVALR